MQIIKDVRARIDHALLAAPIAPHVRLELDRIFEDAAAKEKPQEATGRVAAPKKRPRLGLHRR